MPQPQDSQGRRRFWELEDKMTGFQIVALLLVVTAFLLTWFVGYKAFEALAKRINWCVQRLQDFSD
jgi:hypothetical protein